MPIKRKDFLKKYASISDGTIGNTAYSGRGVGITPGAIGGGDDYPQKIGRNKIPWNLRDFQGSPSMAADAGFSGIALQRIASPDSVTKSESPMFPDQEVKVADDEDIYLSELPTGFKKKMKKEISIDENKTVEDSKYSLVDLENLMSEDVSWRDMTPDFIEDAVDDFDVRDVLPDIIEDEAIEAYDHLRDFLIDAKENYGDPAIDAIVGKLDDLGVDRENIEKATAVAKEIGKDIVMLAAAGTPIVGTPIAASYVLYNLGEMQVGQNQARKAVDNLVVRGTEQDVKEIQKVATELFDDYIDFLQAVPYLIPFVGTVKGVAGVASRAASALGAKKGASFLGVAGGGALKSALRSEILLSPIFKLITSLTDVADLDDIGIDQSYFLDNVYKTPPTLAILSDLIEESEKQLEEWRASGSQDPFKFSASQDEGEVDAAHQRLTDDSYNLDFNAKIDDAASMFRDAVESSGIESAADSLLSGEILKEAKMDYSLIRKFIRETIYHEIELGTAPSPAGYSYRRPERVEDEEDSYKKDPGSLVNYKTDMGGVNYSPVPEDLKEEALRRIVRRKLQEQKKT